MGKTTNINEKVLLERLRADCNAAFRSWTAQVRVLQSVSAGEPPDRGAVEQARRWAEEAAAVYREKRNLLLEFMMHSQGAASGLHVASADNPGSAASAAALKDRTRQIERLARQIWEESGRPAGTAEADWYHAEQILASRR